MKRKKRKKYLDIPEQLSMEVEFTQARLKELMKSKWEKYSDNVEDTSAELIIKVLNEKNS